MMRTARLADATLSVDLMDMLLSPGHLYELNHRSVHCRAGGNAR